MDILAQCRALSDRELIESLETLAIEDRRTTVKLLAHLGEVAHRKLAEDMAYPSLFHFCMRKLHFSEAMAAWRIRAALAARDYPPIFEHIEAGRLNITTVKLIAPYLNKHTQVDLVQRACGKTRKEVEAMIADLAPQPARRDVVVAGPKIIARAQWPEASASTAETPPAIPLLQDVVEALDAQRRRLHFDVGPDTAELIERAREILRHKYPFATLEDIVKEALNILLDSKDLARRLDKGLETPRPSDPAARRIPKWVQREVWRRDGGRCVFVAADGSACGERSWLEFDHVVPFAQGGPSNDPANVRLLCRAHNQAAARPRAS